MFIWITFRIDLLLKSAIAIAAQSFQPKDNDAAREMNPTVFENGTASLQVNFNNRQSVSFDGTVKKGIVK